MSWNAQMAGVVLLLWHFHLAAGCSGIPSPAVAEAAAAETIRLEATPSRTMFLWQDPDGGLTPEKALEGFLSGLDPRVVRRREEAEILISGPFAMSPADILLRWRRESRLGEEGILLEASSPGGRPQGGADDVVCGLRAWLSVHGVRWSGGPVTGVRAYPHLAGFARMWEAAGAAFREIGRFRRNTVAEGVGCAWNAYAFEGKEADWFLYDAFGDNPEFVDELEVVHPGSPFAAEQERDLLASILLRLLPAAADRIRLLLR